MKIMEFGGSGYGWQVLRWDPEYGFSVATYSCGAIDCCEDRFEGSKKISDEEALYIFDKYASKEEREENKFIFDEIRKEVYKNNLKTEQVQMQTITFSYIPKNR